MIRGRTRNKGRAQIAPNFHYKLHNRFDFEVIDSKTGEVKIPKGSVYAENVICDTLWTKMFTTVKDGISNANYFRYIHYGTGSGTPSSSDTALFTYLGYGTPSINDDLYDESHLQDGYFSFTRKIQLGSTIAVGSTLTEVGIAYGSSSGLVTHAMLKDMNGNPISIEKSSTDVINIYGTVFVHWDVLLYQTDLIGLNFYELNNGGMSRSFFRWFVGMLDFVYRYDGVLASHGGKFQTLSDPKPMALTANSATKTLQGVMTRAAVGDFNFTGGIYGIQCFAGVGDYGAFTLYAGGNWYPGTAITSETIGTGDGATTDFSTDFGFVSSGAKIYINGVEQLSGVTIDEDHPLENTDMGIYFIGLYAVDSYNVPFNAISSPTQQKDLPRLSGPTYSAFSQNYIYTYYNPNYLKGISSIGYLRASKLEVSNDGSTWVTLSNSTSTLTSFAIPAAYQYYKYWRFTGLASSNSCAYGFVSATGSATNIHFATAPASDAIITADYTTKMIAKDTNHVFDLTISLTLAEYTE